MCAEVFYGVLGMCAGLVVFFVGVHVGFADWLCGWIDSVIDR